MISDTLSETYDALRHYLGDPTYDVAYAGEMRARIEALLLEMKAVRVELDRPPI